MFYSLKAAGVRAHAAISSPSMVHMSGLTRPECFATATITGIAAYIGMYATIAAI